MKEKLFEQFEKALNDVGYTNVWVDKSEEVPFEHLNVFLPQDSKGRDRALVVREIREALVVTPSEEETKEDSFIQIFSVLPFPVSDESVGEVSRVVSFINKSLATPGFVCDEASHVVFFRYSFLKPGQEISEQTFISLIGTVLLYLDSFGETMEEVASGKGMVDVLNEKLKELAEVLPSE